MSAASRRTTRAAVAAVVGAVSAWANTTATAAVDPTVAAAIGYTDLVTEFGGSLPTGSGVTAALVEANDGGFWVPATASANYAGKTFTTFTAGSLYYSTHADQVASNWFGVTTSMTPGVTSIQLWEANGWIGNYLHIGTTVAPSALTFPKVSNHSYAGTAGAADPDALRRLDYIINRDNAVVVVATSNGGSDNALPPIWAQNYNGITVGLTNGNHGRGLTDTDGSGRIKPDLVVPGSFTSFATPYVTSAATMIVDKAQTTPALADAVNTESVKSILMAGATKITEFGLGPGPTTWDRTPTRPLDERFGAGELNVQRSYHILIAGEHHASTIATVTSTGWDFNTTAVAPRSYFFDLGGTASEVSVLLTWNRVVIDADPTAGFLATALPLSNLDLTLSNASGLVVGTQIDSSVSTVDNVEHIYLTGLAAGQYVLQVNGPSGVDYGLAWFSAVPEPGGIGMILIGLAIGITRRRRRAVA